MHGAETDAEGVWVKGEVSILSKDGNIDNLHEEVKTKMKQEIVKIESGNGMVYFFNEDGIAIVYGKWGDEDIKGGEKAK